MGGLCHKPYLAPTAAAAIPSLSRWNIFFARYVFNPATETSLCNRRIDYDSFGKDFGPHITIYNRFTRWSRLGVFNRIFAELAANGPKPERLMIDATYLKAHRTAASLFKRWLFPGIPGARKAA
jgi:hypothetical protein